MFLIPLVRKFQRFANYLSHPVKLYNKSIINCSFVPYTKYVMLMPSLIPCFVSFSAAVTIADILNSSYADKCKPTTGWIRQKRKQLSLIQRQEGLGIVSNRISCSGPGSSVGIATTLRDRRSGDRISLGAGFSTSVQTGSGAHPASCTVGTVSFPGVKRGRGVTLTPHPILVALSWKGRSITLLPLSAVRPVQSLSACTTVHFTFTLGYPACYFPAFRIRKVHKTYNRRRELCRRMACVLA
jgi:hypothetical protein